MNTINIVSGMINISRGLLFIMISIPLAKQKIAMNKFYGFRFKKAFDSDEHWYRINTYGGKLLILWSILLIMTIWRD